jgi:hypothetical protein
LFEEGIWRTMQLTGRPMLNFPLIYSLGSKIDVQLVDRALREITQRHAVLHVKYFELQGCLHKESIPGANIATALCEFNNIKEVFCFIVSEFNTHMRLSSGELVKSYVLTERDAGQQLLVFLFHHIIFDGGSRVVFERELENLYQSYLGRHTSLLPIEMTYDEFGAAHRATIEKGGGEQAQNFWKTYLHDSSPIATSLQSEGGLTRSDDSLAQSNRIVQFELSRDCCEAVNRLAVTERVTPFMLCLASFLLLLRKHSKQADIVVCCASSARTTEEVQNLIGCFLTAIWVRVCIMGSMTLRELISAIRKEALAVHKYSSIPRFLLKDIEHKTVVFNFNRGSVEDPILGKAKLTPVAFESALAGTEGAEVVQTEFDMYLAINSRRKNMIGVFYLSETIFELLGAKVAQQYCKYCEMFMHPNWNTSIDELMELE